MASVNADDLSDDYGSSSQETSHPTKRRKLHISNQDRDTETATEVGGNHSSSSSTEDQGKHGNDVQNGEEANKVKLNSKYKIHIPKKSELPTDAFFTQPPPRSSSPYRIDQFHWRKPRKPSLSPPIRLETVKQRTPQNPHVSTTTLVVRHDEDNVEDELFQPPNTERLIHEDEFGFDESYEDMLADLPSEVFSSPRHPSKGSFGKPAMISSQPDFALNVPQRQRLAAPIANLKQTTLFGTQAQEASPQPQAIRKRNWPMANREEPATHHKLDQAALKTWIYPTNIGTIRDYQYSIVARGLYHNMLVALPTGLGKTFIAATIMLNWFRWTTDAQIVFVAPTKPLVSQQVKACFDIAGIPRSATTMLTGGISPGLRAEEWQSKRIFFMTPQTIVNDLKNGICDAKRLVLLVVDEAHRATGGYAYVEVVQFLKRFNSSFRVLALTATPGASIEKVQEVIDGLGISKVEIRTEESIDIRQYVHPRKIETMLFENSEEMVMVMDLFSKALRPVLDKLTGMNAYWMRDPMSLTPFGCNEARKKWMISDAGKKADWGVKGMINTIFSLLASLAHGTELLKYHGIGPFYHKVLAFRNDLHTDGKKGGKYARQINESEHFQTMMSRVQSWINNPDFVGHPKLEYLQNVVMNHFLDAGNGIGASDPSSTRVMVFSHYRDSAEEIARVLKRNEPMIRPHVFVGQASSKGSDGMDQKKQLDIIQKFQTGIYNTLVATSIGEEGLDIGEVDLIICYDASASPIRMLQRMGRTGRKRAGNIVVTLMKGKEEDNFMKAKESYEKMQQEIAVGTRFNFHDEESRRIVPRDIVPVVDKKIIEIPPENTQAELPEPTKRGRRVPKRPAKKFHMPDGVRTGFLKASRLGDDEDSNDGQISVPKKKRRTRLSSPELLPPLEQVLLSPAQEREFERRYLDVQGDTPQIVEVPRLDAVPDLQRLLRPTKYVSHGRTTKQVVGMLGFIHDMPPLAHGGYKIHLQPSDEEEGRIQADKRARYFRQPLVSEASPQVSYEGAERVAKLSERASNIDDKSYDLAIAPIDMSSSGELASDESLCDFVVENMDETLDNASSTSSSPIVSKHIGSFYQPRSKTVIDESDSSDDLPELGNLVWGAGSPKAVAISHGSIGTTRTGVVQRNRGRKVVEDSDDE